MPSLKDPGIDLVEYQVHATDGKNSTEMAQNGDRLEGKVSLENNAYRRLGVLHRDILNSADVVEQVQEEVLQLRQENEALRKSLSLAGLSDAGGDMPGLRSSAGPENKFYEEVLDGPRPPATARTFVAKPQRMVTVSSRQSDIDPKGRTSAASSNPGKGSMLWIPSDTAESSFVVDQATAVMGANPTEARLKSLAILPKKSYAYEIGRRASLEFESQRTTHIRGMVFDAAMVKEQLKKNIIKKDLNVTRFYYTEGWAQWIARSVIFENISLGVICVYTIWVAIDTEHNQADVLIDADVGFQVVEHIFCTFFFLEILIRFAAFQRKRDCIRSGWFLFDSLLAVTMVTEDWVMTFVLLISDDKSGNSSNDTGAIKNAAILRVMRLLRLARVGRFLRLMRQSPEVMIMVKAIWGSLRCVVWTCVLLAALMFIFGMCFTQLCKETPLEERYFPSLTGSLHTLFVAGLFPDLDTLSRAINKESLLFWVVFIVYMMLSNICVLNLLIGVLVEVVKSSSTVERDAMDVAYVKQVFARTLELRTNDDISTIAMSKESTVDILQHPEVLEALTKVGIDVLGLVDLMDFIFIKGTVSVADFLEIILQLRSSADVTVKDVVEVRKFLTYEINNLKQQLKEIILGIHSNRRQSQTVADTLEVKISKLGANMRKIRDASPLDLQHVSHDVLRV